MTRVLRGLVTYRRRHRRVGADPALTSMPDELATKMSIRRSEEAFLLRAGGLERRAPPGVQPPHLGRASS